MACANGLCAHTPCFSGRTVVPTLHRSSCAPGAATHLRRVPTDLVASLPSSRKHREGGDVCARAEQRDDEQMVTSDQDTLTQQPLVGPPQPSQQADILTFGLVLAQFGAVIGTMMDGLHSRVQLQIYDIVPLQLGGLSTSLAVPPLLAVFYLVLGALVPFSDNLFSTDPATQKATQRATDVAFVGLSFGVLALLTHSSAVMYSQDQLSFSQISAVLGAGALLNWFLFDGTKQGLALSTLCAIGAPLSEVVLLHFVPLWHYPRADVEIIGGPFVSWVPWCYFFYVPALSNLARFLWSVCQPLPPADQPSQKEL